MTVLKMSRIRLRRKKRKTSKLRGRRYAGYGQVSGGHRKSGQRGGFGRAGVKDHMKINLLRKGHEFGSRGFTHYGPYRPQYPINVGKIIELAKEGLINAKEEHKKFMLKKERPPKSYSKRDLELTTKIAEATIDDPLRIWNAHQSYGW